MFSLCRLCAKCPEPNQLTIKLSELEIKLAICCGWQRSKNENQMPKKVCNSCADRLQSSWNFVEGVWAAEKQLHKLIKDQIRLDSDDELIQTVQPKEKIDVAFELEEFKKDEIEVDPSEDIDNDYGIFGEALDYSNDDDSTNLNDKQPGEFESKSTSGRKQRRRRINDPFLAAVNYDERLGNGLISVNGISRLENLFPNMKSISWNDCQYRCDECNQTFKGSCQFYCHIRSKHNEDLLSIKVPCVYCNATFRRDIALNRHIAAEHFSHLKFRCPHCTDYYWNICDLNKHRLMHTDVQYNCETCGSTFTSKDNFYMHCASHFKEKKVYTYPDVQFICDICQKIFKSKGSIRNHMVLHTDKYDHICEICGWKFQSKGNLKGHLASTHTTEKPFKCEHCPKTFKTNHHLRNHSIMHDDNFMPHVCSICGIRFKRKNTLVVHVRSHTNEYPYSCKFCSKNFKHCITKQTHERAHMNFKPYACTECPYACTSKGNLNKHMMRAHSIDFRNHVVKLKK